MTPNKALAGGLQDVPRNLRVGAYIYTKSFRGTSELEVFGHPNRTSCRAAVLEAFRQGTGIPRVRLGTSYAAYC